MLGPHYLPAFTEWSPGRLLVSIVQSRGRPVTDAVTGCRPKRAGGPDADESLKLARAERFRLVIVARERVGVLPGFLECHASLPGVLVVQRLRRSVDSC